MQVTEKKVMREAYLELSRKWAITLLKDMFLGCKRFTDFLEVPRNIDDHLSNRVLANQLKRLEDYGFIKKSIDSVTNKTEYTLTQMGLDLNKVLYEKIMWAIKYGIVDRNDPYFRGKNIEEIFRITKDLSLHKN